MEKVIFIFSVTWSLQVEGSIKGSRRYPKEPICAQILQRLMVWAEKRIGIQMFPAKLADMGPFMVLRPMILSHTPSGVVLYTSFGGICFQNRRFWQGSHLARECNSAKRHDRVGFSINWRTHKFMVPLGLFGCIYILAPAEVVLPLAALSVSPLAVYSA